METTNYGKFTFDPINRKIYPAHVKKMVESISKIGYIKSKPILVNSDLMIIDGQHRYVACRELDVPIHYEIIENDSKHVILALNEAQKHWSIADYVHMNAELGIRFYQEVEKLNELHKLGISNSIHILTGEVSYSCESVRIGQDFPIYPLYQEIINFILFSKEYLSFWRHSKYVRSIIEVHQFCSPKDLKILQAKCMLFTPQANHQDFMTMYENILNKGKKKNKIKLTK